MNHSDAKIIQADLKAEFLKLHQRDREIYAGLVLGLNGEPDHHLFILSGEFQGNWNDAMQWAKDLGAELPNRREGRILFANAKASFKEDWYWLSEQHSDCPGFAWMQYFYDGYQSNGRKSGSYRARAVRRLILQ